ncbi:MAG: 6-phosphogluconolactonase [Candidatus Parcubacteria bacterium]
MQFLRENGLPVYQHHGIAVVKVHSEQEGIGLLMPLLTKIVTRRTVLYLSGGRTPKELYTTLAKSEELLPGAVAMVDERFGVPMHESSNEKMLRDSGLFRYIQMRDIPFYPVLSGKKRSVTADEYDQVVRTMLAQYQQHIAILGVGMDGHTAGIPAVRVKSELHNANGGKFPDWYEDLQERSKNRMVIDYDDGGPPAGGYKERITMTFQGLSMMDVFFVLVFGKDKNPALQEMFADGSEEEVPSRFLKRSEIATKTLLITDQMI